MKRLKLVFIALALVAGVGGALASRPDPGCEYAQQYYYNGTGYVPVPGEFGVGWICEWAPSNTCTYYKPHPMQPNYVACRSGFFRFVFAIK
jgi:hypothetical protein